MFETHAVIVTGTEVAEFSRASSPKRQQGPAVTSASCSIQDFGYCGEGLELTTTGVF
jgi:hypothetical protein